jgi:hypothetical protein
MMAGFDHEPYFSLQAGHSEIECSACHQKEQYVGLSTTCSDCHAEPELHAGVFGNSCERCHSATAWLPAELKQHTFAMQHGDEPVQTCETCHAGTYTEYPCGSCHEDKEMQTAHIELRGADIHDCISCHPTGRGKEMAVQPGFGEDTPGMSLFNKTDEAPFSLQGQTSNMGASKH